MLNQEEISPYSKAKQILNFQFSSIQAELAQLEQIIINEFIPQAGPLTEIIKYILMNGGKRIRPSLALVIGNLSSTSQNNKLSPKHYELAQLTELIHTASLVHDDILDEAISRRGKDSIHVKWDTKISVITGDFLFAQASVKLGKLECNEIVCIYADVLANLCIGELKQAQYRFDIANLNWDNYLEKSFHKTASLFAATTKSAGLLNNQSPEIINDLYNFGKNLGLAFQIIDDLLDFISTEKDLGKPILTDLKQGILTAPVLYALNDSNESIKLNLTNLIQSRFPDGSNNLKEAEKIIKESGAFEKTFNLAKSYIQQANDNLKALPDNEYKKDLFLLGDFILARLI